MIDERLLCQIQNLNDPPNLVGPFNEDEQNFIYSQTILSLRLLKIQHIEKNDVKLIEKARSSTNKAYETLIKEVSDLQKQQVESGAKRASLRRKQNIYRAQFNYFYENRMFFWKFHRCEVKVKKIDEVNKLIDAVNLQLSMAQKAIDEINFANLLFIIEINRTRIREIINSVEKDPKVKKLNKDLKIIRQRLKNLRKTNRDWFIEQEEKIYQFSARFYNQKFSFYVENVADAIFEEYFHAIKNEDILTQFIRGSEMMMKNPKSSGQIILKLSETLTNNTIKKDPKAKEIFFMLITRHIFGNLYTRLYRRMTEDEVKEVSVKFEFFRNYSMDIIIANKKAFPSLMTGVPISSLDTNHPYLSVIGELDNLIFQCNPIDFCYATLRLIDNLQNIASNMERDLEMNTTGKLTALSDHLLCVDDIIDIIFVLILISQPIELGQMISMYEPYVNGLMLPQNFVFAFLTLNQAWSRLMTTNFDDFNTQANDYVTQTMDADPLGITRRLSHH